MQITEITVSYGRTHNLGNYSNVRPELRLTAVLDAGEDVDTARAQLLAAAKACVQEAIDEALEDDGQRAHFDPGPRFQVLKRYKPHRWGRDDDEPAWPFSPTVLILPNETPTNDLSGYVSYNPDGDSRKLRLDHARRVAKRITEEEPGTQIIDCSDGELSRIPQPPRPAAPAEGGGPTPSSNPALGGHHDHA